jgi:DNA polymerase III epsilon subunit-like protein
MDYAIKKHALNYHKFGLNITCLSEDINRYNVSNYEKAPAHPWKKFQVLRQEDDLLETYPWSDSIGVGCVLGYNQLRCIDIDTCSDDNVVKDILRILRLPSNYEWCVKTPSGFHVYFYCEALPFTINEFQDGVLALRPNSNYQDVFERIEYRWAGHCVLPANGSVSSRYHFILTDFGQMPKSKPLGVSLFPLLKVIAKFSGEFDDLNGYSGNAVIGNFKVRFSACSHGGYFAFSNLDGELIVEKDGFYSDSFSLENDKYNAKKVFFDIETTGLIQDRFDFDSYPRIIQIAFKTGESVNNYYVLPLDFTVNDKIMDLTGLTNKFLSENGMPIGQVLGLTLAKCQHYSVLVGHNLQFDLAVLDSEILRLKTPGEMYRVKKENSLRKLTVFDTMLEFTKHQGGKYLTLDELYERFFDEKIDIKTHNAINDITIVERIFNIMKLYGYCRELS